MRASLTRIAGGFTRHVHGKLSRARGAARRGRDSSEDGWSIVELMGVVAIGLIIAGVAALLIIQGRDTASNAVAEANFGVVRDQLRFSPPRKNDIELDGSNPSRMLGKEAGSYLADLNSAVDNVEVVPINDWLAGRTSDQIGIWVNPFRVKLTNNESGDALVTETLPEGHIIVLVHADNADTRCLISVQSRQFPIGTAYQWIDATPGTAIVASGALEDYAHCGLANGAFTAASQSTGACNGAACDITDISLSFASGVTGFVSNLAASDTVSSLLNWSGANTNTTYTNVSTARYGCATGWPTQPADSPTALRGNASHCPS